MARGFGSQAPGGSGLSAADSAHRGSGPEGPEGPEGSVSVRCFPESDEQFSAHVHEVIANSWEPARNAEALLAVVRRRLADRYPNATIQPRNQLAELGPHQRQTWYAYRDGRAA
jgi:hypothetical protein